MTNNDWGRDYPDPNFGRDLGGATNVGRTLGGATNFGRDYAAPNFGREVQSSSSAGVVAVVAGRQLYSASSWWNQTMAARGQTTVHANSAAMMTALEADADSPADPAPVWSTLTDQFTMPVYEVFDTTVTTPITVSISTSWRFADDTLVGGNGLSYPYTRTVDVPVGVTLKPAPGSDSQIVILNWVTGREWNFYACDVDGSGNWATNVGGEYTCQNAAGYDQLRTGLAIPGQNQAASLSNVFWNVRGAKVPYATGLVRKQEMLYAIANSASLPHAMAFAFDYPLRNDKQAVVPAGTAKLFDVAPSVYPATQSDGGKSTYDGSQVDVKTVSANDPPEGICLRIKAAKTEADMTALGLSNAAKVLVRTLQTYGAFCIDSSGRPKFYLEADVSANWAASSITTTSMLASVPWSWFELMDFTVPDGTGSAGANRSAVQGVAVPLTAAPQLLTEPNGYARGVYEYKWLVSSANLVLSSSSIAAPSIATGAAAAGAYTVTLYVRDSHQWWQTGAFTLTITASSYPYLVTTTSGSANSGLSRSLTLPASAQTGDMILICCNVDNATNQTFTVPGTLTQITNSPLQNGSVIKTVYAYRILTGADTPGTTTYTISWTTSLANAMYLLVYRPSTGKVISLGTTGTNADTSNNTAQVGPSITTLGTNSTVVVLGGHNSGSLAWGTPPSGFSQQLEVTGGKRVVAADRNYPTLGTVTGALSYTTATNALANMAAIEVKQA